MSPTAELIELLQSVAPEKSAFIEARATLLELLPRLAEADVNEAELALIRQSAQVQQLAQAVLEQRLGEALSQPVHHRAPDLLRLHEPRGAQQAQMRRRADFSLA